MKNKLSYENALEIYSMEEPPFISKGFSSLTQASIVTSDTPYLLISSATNCPE